MNATVAMKNNIAIGVSVAGAIVAAVAVATKHLSIEVACENVGNLWIVAGFALSWKALHRTQTQLFADHLAGKSGFSPVANTLSTGGMILWFAQWFV